MAAYYNENDPYAAEWLRNMIAAGHIAPGDVDERSIEDVQAADLEGYQQCHFFAGIGGWSLALRLAGWPDDRPVWTGSPPCQPFSVAGQRRGYDDARHLAPKWLDLIRQCKPPAVYGEQVASAASGKRWAWLDDLQDALEAQGYAVGAVVLPACGVGAPHIRQRLWFAAQWVGDGIEPGLEGHGRDGDGSSEPGRQCARPDRPAAEGSAAGRVADHNIGSGEQGREIDRGRHPGGDEEPGAGSGGDGLSGGLADSDLDRQQERGLSVRSGQQRESEAVESGSHEGGPSGSDNSFWSSADWLFCRDGKFRPVEPGTFPLADGIPGRVGRLRAYGNAICPQEAAEIIRSAS